MDIFFVVTRANCRQLSAPDAVAAWKLSFFYFIKNENREIKSQITENQRLSLTRVIFGSAADTRAGEESNSNLSFQ
jgi:hypothetical protein